MDEMGIRGLLVPDGRGVSSMTRSMPPRTLCEAFHHSAAIQPYAVAVETVGDTRRLTWRQYAAQVRTFASGLYGLGVRSGDTVAFLLSHRIELYPMEVGAQHIGAVTCSMSSTMTFDELRYVLADARATVVVSEYPYAERVLRSGASVRHVVCVDGRPAGCISLDELYEARTPEFDFDSSWQAVRPDDVVTIVYTWGRVGGPRRIEVKHADLLWMLRSGVLSWRPDGEVESAQLAVCIPERLVPIYLQEFHGGQVVVTTENC
jgi:long-chain acyl-CoA synthetase